MHVKRNISLLIVIALFAVIGCSTSESTTSGSNSGNETDNGTNTSSQTNEDVSRLMISNLSDTYSSNDNTVPQEFSEIKKEVKEDVDLTKGFRIQIYSGQDVSEADTVASKFRTWSDTEIVGYQAETYTFFKAPYYRVHIGDFHNRQQALTFSKMVKRLFKDAWVVYDTVDPYLVPDDTTQFKFQ